MNQDSGPTIGPIGARRRRPDASHAARRGVAALRRQLEERLEFETLLCDLSRRFVHVRAGEVDGEIARSLERLVQFLGVERGTVVELSGAGELRVTHSYAIPGARPMPLDAPRERLPWYGAAVRRGETIRLARLPQDLPDHAAEEKRYCAREGIRASLTVPLAVGGAVLGAVAFASLRAGHAWPDELVGRIRLVGEIFANALLRKRAETALCESELRFRLLADTAPVMVWMSGPDKLCTYFNKRWLEFTGRSEAQELGNGWADGVHGEDLARCLETYVSAFDRRVDFGMEYRLRRADGAYRWIYDTGTPRFSSAGDFLGYIGSCFDITQRKCAEDAVRALSGRLIRTQEAERLRIARELHDDLNQSLALLAIELEQLSRQPPRRREVAERLRALAAHTKQLSSDVHRLSHELHPRRLEHLGLAAALRILAHEQAKQGMRVAFAERDLPPHLPRDAALCLSRIAQESLRNALTHSGTREAAIELLGNAGGIRLRVFDRGAGFDPARSLGGLGLVSMRERARLAGGELSIDSRPGHGTCIEAWIPCPPAQPEPRRAVPWA